MTANHESDWQFIRAQQLPDMLVDDIEQAGQRIAIKSMIMKYDDATRPIFDSIEKSHTDTGAEIVISADYPSIYMSESDDKEAIDQEAEALRQAFQRIQNLGSATTALIGSPRGKLEEMLWYNRGARLLGRDHRKAAVMDDISYLMTTNLHAKAVSGGQASYALRGTHPRAADVLFRLLQNDSEGSKLKDDALVPLQDNRNMLLVNAGNFGRSLIMDTAIEFLEDAEPGTTRFVSQHRPGGKLEAKLVEAQPQLAAYNRPDRLSQIFQSERAAVNASKPDIPNAITPDTHVHGQTLSLVLRRNRNRQLFPEYAGPVVLTGNDNFYWAARWVCASELDVATTNESLFEQVNSIIDEDFTEGASHISNREELVA